MDTIEFRKLILKYVATSRMFSRSRKKVLEQILELARNNRELVPLLRDLEEVLEAQQLLQATFPATYNFLKERSNKPSFHVVFKYDNDVKIEFVSYVRGLLEKNDEAVAGTIPQVYLDCAKELGKSMAQMINKFRSDTERRDEVKKQVIAAQEVASNPSSLREYLEAVRILDAVPNLVVVRQLLNKMLKDPSVSFESLVVVYRLFSSLWFAPRIAESAILGDILRDALRSRARTESEKVSLYHLLREHSDAHQYMEFLFERGDDVVAIYRAVHEKLNEHRPEVVPAIDFSLAYWAHRCALRDSRVK